MTRQGVMDRLDARLLLAMFAALLVAAVWGVTLAQLGQLRAGELADAQREAASLARVFEEHAARTVDAADQAAVYLRGRYAAQGGRLDLARELEAGLPSPSVYNLLTIIDGNGDVALSSKPFQPLNLSDRPHVRAHRDSAADDIYISVPVLGRVSKKWSLQITRRIAAPGGGFGGVVVVSMDPYYFTRLYHDVDIGRHGAIALIGADGIVRVRRAEGDEGMGADVSAGPVVAAMRQAARGHLTASSLVDGRRRLYAYAKVEQYPLYVAVGLDEEESLAHYYTARNRALLQAGLSTAVIVLCAFGLHLLIGRLVRSREEALAAARAKARFLANMSHELRTPLNGVLGYAELIMEEAGASRVGQFAGVIAECGQRQLALVESVLELSALDAGSTPLNLAPASLRELAEAVLAGQAEAAAARRVLLSCELDPALPERVGCDRAKLARVLERLLGNALAHADSGAVRLRIEAADGGVAFSVSDSGDGVPAALQRRVFERFFQADDGPARKRDGAGLGLALAAALVELMGGRMALRSAPGQGATFSFALPLGAVH
ncbi:sensor histidine kinase [Pseudoduganella aquatica]|nr:ATP-binding protein [Pseudoduganella aquatica]